MPVSTDRTPIRNARAAFATARRTLITRLDEAATAIAALKDAERRFADGRPELTTARNARDAAVAAAATARGDEKTKRDQLYAALSAWVPKSVTVDDDFTRLLTSAPMVLFPVRVETRFGVDTSSPPKPVLRVRIYPDEIFINLHEPALTREEYNAAVQYYQARDRGVDTPELWRQITLKMSPERAAYVLRIMTPTFGGGTTTSGTTTTTGGGGPQFPTDILFRASDFSRPAEAVLPDRWIVRTLRGLQVTDYLSNPITEPLTMTADPAEKADSELFTIVGSNPPIKVDDDIAWTVDYARAETQGMAVTIGLDPAKGTTGGFDRIFVFGVKSSMDPLEGAALMEQLFDAHHYTRGLALLPQGTPTNNTESAPTPLPREDPDALLSFAEERNPPPASRTEALNVLNDVLPGEDPADPDAKDAQGNPAPKPDGSVDAAVLARVLGIHNSVFANVAGAKAQEQWRALQMAKVVWPTTLGYFVEQLLRPIYGEPAHAILRGYFLRNVRARGPAPAFRIGQVPYGVLPAVSLLNWQKRGTSQDEGFESAARDTMLRLRSAWRNVRVGSTGNPPGIPVVDPNSSDPLTDLFRVLALHPSSPEVRIRSASGPINSYDLAALTQADYQTWINAAISWLGDVHKAAGQPTWADTVLAKMVFTINAKTTTSPMLLAPDALREDKTLPPEFFDNIAGIGPLSNPAKLVSAAALLDDATLSVGDDTLKNTTFYKVVRNSLLWALVRASIVELQKFITPPPDQSTKELIIATMPVFTFRNVLVDTKAQGSQTPISDTTIVRQEPMVADTYTAFKTLKGTSTAEIDRLFSESLDVTSHRVDAWFTGYATRRLHELRLAQRNASTGFRSIGNYVGGYAFLENVRPGTKTQKTIPGFGVVETQAGNGGFVQAPSLSHAAAAAVLRNGYLSYKDEDATRYAFDLSSARVRGAREILDEVRAGQPLGAALGYRLERAIQDKHPELNQFRYNLRKHYPLVANKSGAANPPPADVVAARNVVDGLAVWNAYDPTKQPPFPTASDLPAVGSTQYQTLVNEIKALGDVIDGVSDLSVGESIFQLMRGDVAAASGNLDSLSRGARPPDPDMAIGQRGGVTATHRASLVFAEDALPVATGWTAPGSVRSGAEPLLDAWAGAILGNPTAVIAKAIVRDTTGATTSVNVNLDNLQLRPIDFVALARAGAVANAGSILDRRIATVTLSSNPNRTLDKIDYTVAPGAPSFPEVTEVARGLGALIGGSRALWGDDLVTPTDAPARRTNMSASDNAAASEIALRIPAVTTAFGNRLAALKVTDPTDAQLRTALVGAADFVPDAFPSPTASSEELKAAAATAAAELEHRSLVASGVPLGTGPLDNIERNTATLRAYLGNDLLLLPKVTPPNAPEIDLSFAARSTLLSLSAGDDGSGVLQQFIQRAAQVYDGVGRWRLLSLYMHAIGRDMPRIDLAQLPHRPNAKWIGGFFGTGAPPLPGSVSLLLLSFGAAAPSRAQPWRGLVLQDWVEVIPNATEQTGLAFHYDNPGAEAGQAVLVVPPSLAGTTYKPAEVWGTLGETMDLARIRAVDLQLTPFGQLLPAIYLEQNVQNATVSTAWIVEVGL